MKKVIDFLTAVRRNNNREWFEAHRDDYRLAKEEFDALAQELIDGIAGFDPTVGGLTLREVTYRIYNDMRFHNKEPYKTHMGAYICRGGKKSPFGGYYFHVEPGGDGVPGASFLSSGMYMPMPAVLKSVREDIAERGEEFEAAIGKAKTKGFALGMASQMKRLPTGYAPGGKYDEYLKLKDIYLSKALDGDYLLRESLGRRIAGDFAATAAFAGFLNRAAEIALEDM